MQLCSIIIIMLVVLVGIVFLVLKMTVSAELDLKCTPGMIEFKLRSKSVHRKKKNKEKK